MTDNVSDLPVKFKRLFDENGFLKSSTPADAHMGPF
jgi:hypothetical protein